jgi:hypothetical protein
MTVTPITLRTVAAMFSIKGSAGAELKNFKALAAADAVKCKQIYADGEKLIVLAGNGEYAQFKRYASTLDDTSIMGYFSAKALMASLIGGHLMLSTFILENGYPLNMTVGLPNIVHDCLRELSDFECVPIVRLFVSKGFDVNRQVSLDKNDLHVPCLLDALQYRYRKRTLGLPPCTSRLRASWWTR